MKVREAKSILKHVEGMSSDDEVTEMESSMFKNQRGMASQQKWFSCVGNGLNKYSTTPYIFDPG